MLKQEYHPCRFSDKITTNGQDRLQYLFAGQSKAEIAKRIQLSSALSTTGFATMPIRYYEYTYCSA